MFIDVWVLEERVKNLHSSLCHVVGDAFPHMIQLAASEGAGALESAHEANSLDIREHVCRC